MRWCCIYHVTRDSIHAIQRTLQTEPVHLLGHTQWVLKNSWSSLIYDRYGFLKNLEFLISFSTSIAIPIRKFCLDIGTTLYFEIICNIISYHRAGAEEWCKKPLEYGKVSYFFLNWSCFSSSPVHF